MTASFDDRFDDHPKYAECSAAEMGLIACGITYSNRNLTDGVIPRIWPERRFGREGARIAKRLVEVGIWSRSGDGSYEIVGFLDHNPSRADVLADRARAAEARTASGRVGGIRSGHTRRAQKMAKDAAAKLLERHETDEANAKQKSNDHSSKPSKQNEANAKQTVEANEAGSDQIRSDPPLPPETEPVASELPASRAVVPLTSTTVAFAAAEVYVDTVSRALGGFTMPRGGPQDVRDVVNGHARPGASWAELKRLLVASVSAYLSAGLDPKFEKGFSPKKWGEWCNAGNGWTLRDPPPTTEAEDCSLPVPLTSEQRAEAYRIAMANGGGDL